MNTTRTCRPGIDGERQVDRAIAVDRLIRQRDLRFVVPLAIAGWPRICRSARSARHARTARRVDHLQAASAAPLAGASGPTMVIVPMTDRAPESTEKISVVWLLPLAYDSARRSPSRADSRACAAPLRAAATARRCACDGRRRSGAIGDDASKLSFVDAWLRARSPANSIADTGLAEVMLEPHGDARALTLRIHPHIVEPAHREQMQNRFADVAHRRAAAPGARRRPARERARSSRGRRARDGPTRPAGREVGDVRARRRGHGEDDQRGGSSGEPHPPKRVRPKADSE